MTAAVEAWQKRGATFDFRGHEVFHLSEGEGSALLCIHGYPTSSWDWSPVWPQLRERHRVVACDMLGFGLSAKPRGHSYTIDEQADLQVALLRAHGNPPFHLLCHDYGDTVGQELLARHREGRLAGLRSVTLLNGGLFPETHRARPIQKLLASPLGPLIAQLFNPRSFTRSMRAIFGPRTQPAPEVLDTMYELCTREHGKLALARLISYMEERRRCRERWVSALVSTELPLLVVNGVLDPVSGAHMVERLLELRPHTEVLRLDVGHYPQVEAPEAVARAVLAHTQAHD